MEQTFGGLTIKEIIIAAVIVVVFCGLAWFIRFALEKWVKQYTKKTATKLDDSIILVMQKPVITIIVLLGFYIAVLTLPQEKDVWSYTLKGLATALSLMGIFSAVVFIDTIINWYRRQAIASNNVGLSIRLIGLSWIVIILVAIWLSVMSVLGIWGKDVSIVTGWLGEHGWRIALIIGIAVVAIVGVGEIIPRMVVRTLARRPRETKNEVKKRSDTLSKVLVSTSQVFIVFIAAFMILSELRIDIMPIMAGVGVVGIAIGFGAQNLVRDLLAGFFIIIENQYRVGDVIKIADVGGIVESINLRRTVLRDLDGIVHVVPNGEIRVANNLTKELSRINFNVSVGYGEDLDHVIKVINRVGQQLAEDPEWKDIVLIAPKVLRVDNFGDSGIDIRVAGDTQPMRQWDVAGQLRLRLKREFDKEGIEIPWPHTKVYFGNALPILNSNQKAKDK
ncbi:MAG: mechanosensitive ion channel family protein [Dehalococcoidales bacterium]|nr:mechanosensitive ion channel family protein [Dehalococcoidales bacterium]